MELSAEAIGVITASIVALVAAGAAAAHKTGAKSEEKNVVSNIAVIGAQLNSMAAQLQKVADVVEEGFRFRDEKRDGLAIAIAELQAELRSAMKRIDRLENRK